MTLTIRAETSDVVESALGKECSKPKTAVAKALKQGYSWEDVWGVARKTVWWEQSESGRGCRR